MGTETAFAYCNARIHARFAALPGEEEWGRLAGTRTLAGFIEEARGGPLRPWLKGFSALSDPHAIERGLRALFRDLVDELAAWSPGPWRAAVRWVAWVPLLPALAELARGGRVPSWLRQDYCLEGLLGDAGEPDADAISAAGLIDVVRPGAPDIVAERWLDEWRRRCAATGRGTRRELDALVSTLTTHLAVFRRTSAEQTWELRHRLRGLLCQRFHQQPLRPVTVFLYLTILLLDIEHLRAALVGRALFGEGVRG